ncbi:hypothetical protein syc1595_d [Synechococcus elongatus PCC 6301]|uniref:Coenzyme Q-binding protein COQ10 START domain-containing protein n=1 Tax=Synechococcus sp. (strain ATCC 27144 / PCC 6301 / SAUG 1402/1) TaxID=269084 RepID=A0A0H3KA62_SYNP6|nr:SRPBCC family protein [Synechococcus elongatus]BAD79785.1 hypothetical protein syc1595_d [Synechococcus elongatus PCC 6301]
MRRFQRSTVIDAPRELVWAFHEQADVLEQLTPPWLPVEVVRREGGLGPGAVSEFRLWLGPVPIRWVATHNDDYEPGRCFCDRQSQGPFADWLHRHIFSREGDRTRLIDEVEYALPGGWLPELSVCPVVDAQLERLFAYRQQVTKQWCESRRDAFLQSNRTTKGLQSL